MVAHFLELLNAFVNFSGGGRRRFFSLSPVLCSGAAQASAYGTPCLLTSAFPGTPAYKLCAVYASAFCARRLCPHRRAVWICAGGGAQSPKNGGRGFYAVSSVLHNFIRIYKQERRRRSCFRGGNILNWADLLSVLRYKEQRERGRAGMRADHRADVVDMNLLAADLSADHIRQQYGVVITVSVADEHNLVFRIDGGLLHMLAQRPDRVAAAACL